MSIRDDIGDHALRLEGAWRDPAWDIEGDIFKTAKGKIFLICAGDDRAAAVTLKLAADERTAALTLPFVRAASWPRRWITAAITGETEREIALEWVALSYALVSSGR